MNIYTENQNDIIHETSVDFVLRPCTKEIHIVQYDKSLPIVKVELFKNGERYVLPENAAVNVRVGKLDHTFVYESILGTNEERNIVYFEISEQMATIPGKIWPVLEVIETNKVACSSPLCFIIERNPIQEGQIESHDDFPIIYELQGTVADHEARITHLESRVSGDVVNLHDYQVIDGDKDFTGWINFNQNGVNTAVRTTQVPTHNNDITPKWYVDNADQRKLELHTFDGFKEGAQIEDQIRNGEKIYCESGQQTDFDPTDNPLIEFVWTVSGTKRPVYFKSIYIKYVRDSDQQVVEFNKIFTESPIPNNTSANGATFTVDGITFMLEVIPFSASDDVKVSAFDNTKGVHIGTTSLAANVVKLQSTTLRNCTIKEIKIETSGAGTASRSSRTLYLNVGNDRWNSNGSTEISFTTTNTEYTFNNGENGTHIGSGEGEIRTYSKVFISKSSSGVISTENPNSDYLYISSNELRLYKYINQTMQEVSKTRLGTTSDTAYRGDYGQDNYNQIQAIKSQTYTFSGTKTFNDTVITKNTVYLAGQTVIYTGRNSFREDSGSLMICLDEPNEEWMSIGLGGRREIDGLNNIITHSTWVEEGDQFISDTFYFDGSSEVSYSEGSPRTPFPNGSARVGIGKLYLNSLDSKLSIAWGTGQYEKTNGVILVGHDKMEAGPITLARFYGSMGSIRFASLLRNANDSISRYECASIYAGSPWISTPPLISRYGLNIPDTSEYTEERYVATTYDISQSLENYVAKNNAITGATKCKITYDSKGLVTAGADLAASDIPSLDTSKITSGTFNIARIPTGTTSTTVALGNHNHDSSYVAKNNAITGATKCKITYDSKGLVTAGADLAASDIPSLDTSKITSGTFADARIASASTWNAKYTKPSGGIPASDLAETYIIANEFNIQNGPTVGSLEQIFDGSTFNFVNPNSPLGGQTINIGIATGTYATMLGGKGRVEGKRSFVNGTQVVATGAYSHAEGNNAHASGANSHAEGIQTYASGSAAHAEGSSTAATETGAHSEGYGTHADGVYTHAEGSTNYALGDNSHAEGGSNIIGVYSGPSPTPTPGPAPDPGTAVHAEGMGSHAEGNNNTITGVYSHAEGQGNTISSNRAHAEGNGNTVSGLYAHAEGNSGVASGEGAHSEGLYGHAIGNYSHAEGAATYANGLYSHAAGQDSTANGTASFASGFHVTANRDYQTVLGKYNLGQADTLFEVGNGTADNARSNAFEVYQDGTLGISNFDANGNKIGYKRIKCINGVLTIID